MTGHPLSVVVIPLVGGDALTNCLDRLPLATLECIVVLREAFADTPFWRQRYPSVTFLSTADEPVPSRREYGLRVAAGDVVGIIEDTSWPDDDWCAAILAAFADPQTAAAGGPVRVAPLLPNRYRALAASEYGAFAAGRRIRVATGPNADEPVAAFRVPGNNMAFRRSDVMEALRTECGGLFEGSVCAELLAKGRRVVYSPRMSVIYSACDRHNASLLTRLHHGRIYAAAQVHSRPWPRRLGHLAKTPCLPLLLTWRRMRSLSSDFGVPMRLPILPWLLLMESAWALGEAAGALTGAGKSINAWR